jgi:hypothetical protein
LSRVQLGRELHDALLEAHLTKRRGVESDERLDVLPERVVHEAAENTIAGVAHLLVYSTMNDS